MASDEEQDSRNVFATPRNKLLRTYSHKGRNNRAFSLPALKLTLNELPHANNLAKLQRFRISKAKSWELKPAPSVPLGELSIARAEQTQGKGDGISYGCIGDAHADTQGGLEETSSFPSIHMADEVTSPVSPLRHTQTQSSSVESDERELEGEDTDEDEDEDENNLIVLSQRPLGYKPKHDRRTGNGTRSVRRRPFLIFDKMESKGYKRLKSISEDTRALKAFRYHPGDGFSGREAKPNGSNLLTRNGKQTMVTPHVGILDLTQSEPLNAKRKRAVRRLNRDDNSFVSAPKKRVRRPLEPKDSNKQPKPATPARDEAKKDAYALGANLSTNRGSAAQGEENGHGNENGHGKANGQVHENACQTAVTKADQPRPTKTQQIPSGDDEVDMIIIERSDDAQDDSGSITKHHGIPREEEQDNGGTHISESPPRQHRTKARSVSPGSRHGPAVSGFAWGRSQRAFRRANTQ